MQRPAQHERFNWRASTRKGTLSVVMWVFGLSTTLLLVGLWGRAVTVDQATVAESAATVIDADIAQDRVMDWVEDALVQATSVSPAQAAATVESVRSTPEMQEAIDNLTAAFVGALFAPEGTDPVIDIDAAVRPAIPVIVTALAEQDVALEEPSVLAALDAADFELDTGEAAGVATVVREAHAVVTVGVVVALAVMALAGSAAVALSEERFAMVRTLAVRVVLSALSFSVFFRLGGWALDPDRGRSPIVGGTSVVLGSNGHVFLITAVIAAAVAFAGGWLAWRKRRARTQDPVVATSPTDDDTRELVAIG